ncbi:hypothetical protein GE061_015831 [Apolygus lucorum]|uniref:HTH psq-type domain-containing protein n=1 Tax=Apolygus lucorum TaxID=248454 RepID=A0A8S9XR75_APOLU|nr:hypothetical protein GE061_015831 [Apolygus lucorum]
MFQDSLEEVLTGPSSPVATWSDSASSTLSKKTKICSDQQKRKQAVDAALKALKEDDEFDGVGLNVACKLRRMSEEQQLYAEMLINKVLMNGVKGRLQEETDLCALKTTGMEDLAEEENTGMINDETQADASGPSTSSIMVPPSASASRENSPAPSKTPPSKPMSTFQKQLLERMMTTDMEIVAALQGQENPDKSYLVSLLPQYSALDEDEKLDFQEYVVRFFREVRKKKKACISAAYQFNMATKKHFDVNNPDDISQIHQLLLDGCDLSDDDPGSPASGPSNLVAEVPEEEFDTDAEEEIEEREENSDTSLTMGRRQRRIIGGRPYRNYSDEQLEAVLEAVKEKRISIREAAKRYNIPRNSIAIKLKEQKEREGGEGAQNEQLTDKPTRKRTKKVNVAPGRAITVADLQRALDSAEQTTSGRGRGTRTGRGRGKKNQDTTDSQKRRRRNSESSDGEVLHESDIPYAESEDSYTGLFELSEDDEEDIDGPGERHASEEGLLLLDEPAGTSRDEPEDMIHDEPEEMLLHVEPKEMPRAVPGEMTQKEQIPEEPAKEKFVVVQYCAKLYPGLVLSKDEGTGEIEVSAMRRKGKFWTWPRQAVRGKWKALRDKFRQELQKKPVPRSGDGGGSQVDWKSPWKHFDNLLFLQDQFTVRTAGGSLPEPEVTADYLDTEPTEYPNVSIDEEVGAHGCPPERSETPGSSQRKRKRPSDEVGRALIQLEQRKLELFERKTTRPKETDEDMAFFESLLPHVKPLHQADKLLLRIKIQQLVYDFITQRSGYTREYREPQPIHHDQVMGPVIGYAFDVLFKVQMGKTTRLLHVNRIVKADIAQPEDRLRGGEELCNATT